ncbi:MAG: ATP-binding protein, partial [Spirochaetota bacterium]
KVVYSSGWKSMLGYTDEEVRDELSEWERLVHPEDRPRSLAAVGDLVEGRAPAIAVEMRMRHKDGGWVWVLSRGMAIHGQDGKAARIVGTHVDITGRKRAEEGLKAANAKLEMLWGLASLAEADRKTISDHILASITAMTGSLYGFYGFIDDKEEVMSIHSWSGEAMKDCSMVDKPVDFRIAEAGVWAEAVRRREPFVLEGYGGPHDAKKGLPPGHVALSNLLVVPFFSRGRIVSVAAVANKETTFDQGDIRQIMGFLEGAQAIIERTAAEEKLRAALADLERSNRDLEQFAFAASHDLQEPLRMVASYTQLLAARYEGKLDEKADRYIAYAVDGATRMQALIEDLLGYSRVGTRGKPPEPVDAAKVFAEARRDLEAVIAESHASVTAGGLPTVRADASQLGQVFRNLLSNGLKFRAAEDPRVEVSARREGREWVFSVTDNGIGIDPKYADRVFVIFQRLHTRSEYPGSGIGLAVCKRIVERHGGRIWFEPGPGGGTTFSFALPA